MDRNGQRTAIAGNEVLAGLGSVAELPSQIVDGASFAELRDCFYDKSKTDEERAHFVIKLLTAKKDTIAVQFRQQLRQVCLEMIKCHPSIIFYKLQPMSMIKLKDTAPFWNEVIRLLKLTGIQPHPDAWEEEESAEAILGLPWISPVYRSVYLSEDSFSQYATYIPSQGFVTFGDVLCAYRKTPNSLLEPSIAPLQVRREWPLRAPHLWRDCHMHTDRKTRVNNNLSWLQTRWEPYFRSLPSKLQIKLRYAVHVFSHPSQERQSYIRLDCNPAELPLPTYLSFTKATGASHCIDLTQDEY
jgi:hypothetical protein